VISEEEKVNNIERITVEERHKLDTFVNSPRYNHIQKIKKRQETNRKKRQGACGGKPRKDGSGKGVGNKGTKRQPKKR